MECGARSVTSKGCKCLLLSGVSVIFYIGDTLPRVDGARHRVRLDGLKTALKFALRGRWVWRGPCKITYTRSKTLQYSGVRESWLFQDRALEEWIPISLRSLLPWVGGQGVRSENSVKAVWNTAAKEK